LTGNNRFLLIGIAGVSRKRACCGAAVSGTMEPTFAAPFATGTTRTTGTTTSVFGSCPTAFDRHRCMARRWRHQYSALVMACAARLKAGAAASRPGFGRWLRNISQEASDFYMVRAYIEKTRSFPDTGLRTGRAGSFIMHKLKKNYQWGVL